MQQRPRLTQVPISLQVKESHYLINQDIESITLELLYIINLCYKMQLNNEKKIYWYVLWCISLFS